ncbi:unnamed protein product [Moneuplotes crassus]|uniref:Uncharacterized protein n=1 Tax=Euplotes crassus TaxID=5936 RepID=A0AAD2CXY1_EUPCR|nr:unnamed protein product [Moneuplotes crassus]
MLSASSVGNSHILKASSSDNLLGMAFKKDKISGESKDKKNSDSLVKPSSNPGGESCQILCKTKLD